MSSSGLFWIKQAFYAPVLITTGRSYGSKHACMVYQASFYFAASNVILYYTFKVLINQQGKVKFLKRNAKMMIVGV